MKIDRMPARSEMIPNVAGDDANLSRGCYKSQLANKNLNIIVKKDEEPRKFAVMKNVHHQGLEKKKSNIRNVYLIY